MKSVPFTERIVDEKRDRIQFCVNESAKRQRRDGGGEDEMRRMCHWRVENAIKWRGTNRRPHATVYDENGFSLKCPMLATLKAHQ